MSMIIEYSMCTLRSIYLHHLTSLTVPLIHEVSQVDVVSSLLVWVRSGKLGPQYFLSIHVVEWNVKKNLFLLFPPFYDAYFIAWSGWIDAPVGINFCVLGPQIGTCVCTPYLGAFLAKVRTKTSCIFFSKKKTPSCIFLLDQKS